MAMPIRSELILINVDLEYMKKIIESTKPKFSEEYTTLDKKFEESKEPIPENKKELWQVREAFIKNRVYEAEKNIDFVKSYFKPLPFFEKLEFRIYDWLPTISTFRWALLFSATLISVTSIINYFNLTTAVGLLLFLTLSLIYMVVENYTQPVWLKIHQSLETIQNYINLSDRYLKQFNENRTTN